MDFFEAVSRRRSTRHFTQDPVDPSVIQRALSAAVWAPNSSNLQTWDFFWVESQTAKANLVQACLNQSPARKAQHLIVITANPKLWRRSSPYLAQWVESEQAPPPVHAYYKRLVPITYRWGLLNSFGWLKKIVYGSIGLFRPMMRGPCLRRELQEVAIKSAALAAENFVLAIAAQGYATCMMEGFDKIRVRRILGLGRAYRIVMVIAVGQAAEKPTWGRPFRIPDEMVIHRV